MKQRFVGLRWGGLKAVIATYKTKLNESGNTLWKGITRHFVNALLAVRSSVCQYKTTLFNYE